MSFTPKGTSESPSSGFSTGYCFRPCAYHQSFFYFASTATIRCLRIPNLGRQVHSLEQLLYYTGRHKLLNERSSFIQNLCATLVVSIVILHYYVPRSTSSKYENSAGNLFPPLYLEVQSIYHQNPSSVIHQ